MRSHAWVGSFRLGAAALAAGCAPTSVQSTYQREGPAPRPERVLVYDFSVTPDEVQLDRGLSAELEQMAKGTPRTQQELQVGRKAARALSDELVKRINAMGLPAQRVVGAPANWANAVLIEGQFLSIDEGNRTRARRDRSRRGTQRRPRERPGLRGARHAAGAARRVHDRRQERLQAGGRRDDGNGRRGGHARGFGRGDRRRDASLPRRSVSTPRRTPGAPPATSPRSSGRTSPGRAGSRRRQRSASRRTAQARRSSVTASPSWPSRRPRARAPAACGPRTPPSPRCSRERAAAALRRARAPR